MSAHSLFKVATGISVFVTALFCPWQRPTNANGNGLLEWSPDSVLSLPPTRRRSAGVCRDRSVLAGLEDTALDERRDRRAAGYSDDEISLPAASISSGIRGEWTVVNGAQLGQEPPSPAMEAAAGGAAADPCATAC